MGGSEGQGGSEGSRPHSSDMPRDSTVGTREFKNPDRPDEVSSAGGQLEMQPVQRPTLPGQPAHAMQMQQLPPPSAWSEDEQMAIDMAASREEAERRAAPAQADENAMLQQALSMSRQEAGGQQAMQQRGGSVNAPMHQDVDPNEWL